MKNIKSLFSTLWIFLAINYLFCDIFSLYFAQNLKEILTGKSGEIEFTESFLLIFSMIMELPLIMIIISKVANDRINRISNLVIAIIMLIVQIGSLITGKNTLHYYFFSLIEISTLFIILILALKWKKQDELT